MVFAVFGNHKINPMKYLFTAVLMMTATILKAQTLQDDIIPKVHTAAVPGLRTTKVNYVDESIDVSMWPPGDVRFLDTFIKFTANIGDTLHEFCNGTQIIRHGGILFVEPANPEQAGYFFEFFRYTPGKGKPFKICYLTEPIVSGGHIVGWSDKPKAGTLITDQPLRALRALMPMCGGERRK